MFSCEAIPGPSSCSSNPPALQIDDDNVCGAPASNFSIRDYVFASRSKDVEISWPFSPEILHCCLKRGIKDLLPPFQPPDSVRGWRYSEGVEYKQPTKSSEAAQAPSRPESHEFKDAGQLDEPSIDRGDQLDELIDSNTGILQGEECCEQIERALVHKGKSSDVVITQPPSRLPKRTEANSHELLEKKCSLVVKLGSLSNREDILLNSSKVSDLMASKVCPVCKTFSSTSNTTLNAHIDQCLSVEYNNEPGPNQLSKTKCKPTKKRLMEDIYATAAHCTLEDLDRRNGTNWASELAVSVATSKAAYSETQTQNPLPLDSRDEKSGGAVYVDSHGIKLLILSKIDDSQPVISKEEPRLKKIIARDKADRSTLTSKGDSFGRNLKKKMNDKDKGKNIGSFKLCRTQAEATPEGDNHADACQKDDSLSHLTQCPDPSKRARPETLQQSMCFQSSNLPKGSSHGNFIADTGDLAKKSRKQSSGSSIATGRMSKLFRSSEGFPSQRASSVDFMSKTAHNMENRKQHKILKLCSADDGLLLKYTGTSGASASSSRSKREENCMGVIGKSDRSSSAAMARSEWSRPSVRHQPTLALEKTFYNVSKKPSSSKKLRKHRSLSKHREISSSFSGGTCCPIETAGGHSISMPIEQPNKKLRSLRSNIIVRCRTTSTGKDSSSQSEMPKSDGQGGSIVTELAQHATLNLPLLVTECFDTEIEMQAEGQVSGAYKTIQSMEEVIGERETTKSVIIRSNPSSDSIAKHGLVVEECLPSLALCESHGEPISERSFNELVNGGGIELLANSEFRGEDSCAVQSTECSSLSSIHGINACITSCANTGQDVPREKPSIASSLREEKGTLTESMKGFDRGGDIIAGREFNGVRSTKGGELVDKIELSSKGKQAFSLSSSPRTSSFTAYRSSMRTNQMANLSLKSAAPSNPTRIPAESTQIQSPSNPVLRLMGKDLVVMNNVGEIVNPQAPPLTPDYHLINRMLPSDGIHHQAILPFFCIPSHSQVLSRDVGNGFKPVFANLYPGHVNANIMVQSSSSEGPASLIPSHFIFQCPTGQVSSMYCTPDPYHINT